MVTQVFGLPYPNPYRKVEGWATLPDGVRTYPGEFWWHTGQIVASKFLPNTLFEISCWPNINMYFIILERFLCFTCFNIYN